MIAKSPERIIARSLLITMLGICIFTIFWGSDRGIGLYDDAEYLLSARYPDDALNQVTSVYQYTGLLFELVGYNVAKFRQAGVVILLFGSLVFWFGFTRFTVAHRNHFTGARSLAAVSLPLFCLATLCHYSWFYMTPNYNTLTGFSISITGGLILSNLADFVHPRLFTIQSAFLGFVAGIALGFLFFVKFSASITLLTLVVVVIFIWGGVKKTDKAKFLSSVFTGYAAAFFVHFSYFQPYREWLIASGIGFEIYSSLGLFDIQTKAISYIGDLFFFTFSAIAAYWPAITLSFVSGIVAGFLNGIPTVQRFLAISTSISLGCVSLMATFSNFDIPSRYTNDPFLPRYLTFHFTWILVLTFVTLPWFFLKKRKSINKNKSIIMLIMMLVFMPFAGSVGVTHALYSTAVVYPLSWFGAIFALSMLKPFNFTRNIYFQLLLVVGLGFPTTSQIVFGYLYDSQQIRPTLFDQNYSIEVADVGNSMKLDEEFSVFVDDMRALAVSEGFQHGDDIIALNFLQRVVYAIGGRSPGVPNYAFLENPSTAANYNKRSEIALSHVGRERLKRAFILVNVPLPQAGVLLRGQGLDFPDSYNDNESYIHVGDIKYRGTFHTLFKPKLAGND